MKNEYHIDVTPEEDALFRDAEKRSQKPKINFGKTFWLVFGLHVAVIGIIATTCSAFEVKKQPNFHTPVPEVPLQPSLEKPVAAPQPIVPLPEQKPQAISNPIRSEPTNKKYMETYVVKPGDTVYGIARRYKLDFNKLLKINNISDPSKIVIGQTLKFM